jgi:hypothetical protein
MSASTVNDNEIFDTQVVHNRFASGSGMAIITITTVVVVQSNQIIAIKAFTG